MKAYAMLSGSARYLRRDSFQRTSVAVIAWDEDACRVSIAPHAWVHLPDARFPILCFELTRVEEEV